MYIILAIIATGFLGKYQLLIFGLFITICMYMIVKGKAVYPINRNMILLMLYTISLCVMSLVKHKYSLSFVIIAPILAYYSGLTIGKFSDANESYIAKCVIAIAIGFFIHAMLNYSINIGSNTRNTIDFWIKENISATLQATMLTMIMSMLYWEIFYIKQMPTKFIYITAVILSLAYITVLGSRTPIAIALIVFCVSIILDSILNKNKKRAFKIAIIILVGIISVMAIYKNNLWNIKNSIESSNIAKRFSDKYTNQSDYNRFESQILGLKSIFENPLGTEQNIGNLKYAHNMWLDVGKEYGLIPFVLLAIYSVSTIFTLIQLIKNSKISIKYKILITSIYLGVNINFFTEPIMQGIPFFFIMFTLINGMVDAQYYHLKKGEGR